MSGPSFASRLRSEETRLAALALLLGGILGAVGAAAALPLVLGLGIAVAVPGLAALLAHVTPQAEHRPRELRLGWPVVLFPLAVVAHGAALGALWPVHVALEEGLYGEALALEEGFWLTVVLGSGILVLGLATLVLQRRVQRLASGTRGRVRFVVGVAASTVVIACEAALMVLVALSQREHEIFELDALFGESGPMLWHDTFLTIASGQGTAPLVQVIEIAHGVALAILLVILVSSWFLIPRVAREVFFYVLDGAVLLAFLFALWTLPMTPPEEGDPTLSAIALSISALFLLRLLARLLPLILDAIERSGFRALVAARLLRARKSGFLTVISFLSILAVSFSSCTLTTTLSVMGGFRDDLQQKILGNSAHVVVDREYGTWDGWNPVLERVRAVPGVTGASPYIEGEVMITSASNLGGAVLRGIDPETIVTDLPRNLRRGRMEYLSHPERLLDLSAEEMSGSFLDPVALDPSDAENDEEEAPSPPDAGAPDAGAAASRSETPVPSGGTGLAREIDDLLEALDREIGEGPVSAPLPEPAPELPAGELERAARLEEIDEFLLPEDPDEVRRRERMLDLLPGLIVGAELARSLRLHVGDEVNLVSPNGELGPTGPMPRSRPFRVAGIFYSGMFEYDMQVVYTDLATAQRFLGVGSAITGLQVRVDDWESAEERADAIEAVVARTELRVRSWQEVNRNLFGALQLEKLAMFITLLIAILVASFCVVGALMLMVQEKGREVGILKAMGAEDRQIVGVFLVQGLLIGVLGAVTGCGLGYVVCFAAENFGIAMNPEVYYIDRLPVHVEPMDFVLVGLSAVLVCLVATIYPAVLGSRLRPVDSLRQG